MNLKKLFCMCILVLVLFTFVLTVNAQADTIFDGAVASMVGGFMERIGFSMFSMLFGGGGTSAIFNSIDYEKLLKDFEDIVYDVVNATKYDATIVEIYGTINAVNDEIFLNSSPTLSRLYDLEWWILYSIETLEYLLVAEDKAEEVVFGPYIHALMVHTAIRQEILKKKSDAGLYISTDLTNFGIFVSDKVEIVKALVDVIRDKLRKRIFYMPSSNNPYEPDFTYAYDSKTGTAVAVVIPGYTSQSLEEQIDDYVNSPQFSITLAAADQLCDAAPDLSDWEPFGYMGYNFNINWLYPYPYW